MGGRHPAAWIALIVWLALLAAPAVHATPSWAWCVVAGLGCTLRRRAGHLLAVFCLSLVWAQIRWLDEVRGSFELRPSLSSTCTLDVTSPWRRTDLGWSASARVRTVAQSDRRGSARLEVTVFVATDERPAEARSFRARGSLRPPTTLYNGSPPRPRRWLLSVKSARFLTPLEGVRADWPRRLRDSLMQRMSAAPTQAGGSGLVAALVFGERHGLPDPWLRGLRRSGLSHVLAVSGLHVGLVAWLLLRVVTATPGRRPLRTVLAHGTALGGALAYTLIAGAPVSARRACLMAGLLLLAPIARRPTTSLNALGVAVLSLLLWEPALSLDLSLQLTATATAGVLLAAGSTGARGRLARAFRASWGAWLFTLPVAVPAFSRLPTSAVAANLLAAPWLAVSLSCSFAYVLSLVARAPAATRILAPLLDGLARPLDALADLRPGTLFSVPFSASTTACLGLSAGLAVLGRRPRALAGALLAGWAVLVLPSRDGGLGLTVLDVGQGDGILLHDGSSAALIDGGGWRGGGIGESVLLPALAVLGIRSLDFVAVTHPDLDHCGGAAELASIVPVREVWTGPGWRHASCLQELWARAPRRRVLWAGDIRHWRRWRIEVLHPPAGYRGSSNERSLVLLARAGGRSVLLTGDVGRPSEGRIAALDPTPVADLLKVGHHGSRSSTGPRFLATVRPRWGLISVGRSNRYGHPAAEVTGAVRRGAWLLRTDLVGQIRFRWRAGQPLRLRTLGPAASPLATAAERPLRAASVLLD